MTDTSRRTLLRAGAFGALLAPLVSVRTAFAAATTNLYSRSRFTKLVNAKFSLVTGTSTWPVTLLSVTDLAGARRGDDNRYALTFRSSVTGPTQDTYTLQRNGFSPTTLFVVPSDPERRTYQAIINRMA
jgi:hypothetical protein